MMPIARMLDPTIGVCTSHSPSPITVAGMIFPAQFTVLVNGLPAARMMDIVIANCGHIGVIVTGSSNVFCCGLPMAKMGGSFVGAYTGTILGGSGNVFSS